MAEEYYIRQPDTETARGPFDREKLASLAEAGQVNDETLYYDEAQEAWVRVLDNDDLRRALFPEKKKLVLRSKTSEELNLLNRLDESQSQDITVEQFLAAAEGETSETRHFKKAELAREKAAALSTPLIGMMITFVALSLIFPSWDIIQELIDAENKDYMILVGKPLLLVGLFDLFMAICVFLGATEIYPVIRLRAMMGLGFFGFTYWSYYQISGELNDLYAAYACIAGGIGMFGATLTLNLFLLSLFALAGLAGAGGFAWFTFFVNFFNTPA